MAAKILTGEADISTMPIEFTTATPKYNASICETLGITPLAESSPRHRGVSLISRRRGGFCPSPLSRIKRSVWRRKTFWRFLKTCSTCPGCPVPCAQGLIWGIMAIGVYITYRILDVADLTVDGFLWHRRRGLRHVPALRRERRGRRFWSPCWPVSGSGLVTGLLTPLWAFPPSLPVS